jgi:hypothetical protein
MKKFVTATVALLLLCATFSCENTAQQEMDSLQSVVQSTGESPPTTESLSERKGWSGTSSNEPCTPDFRPEPTLANGCLNHCQYVYEGWASTESDVVFVNCIYNPSNWSLSIQQSGEQSYFQFRVYHDPVIYADLPNGAGLCSRDLIFEPADLEADIACLEYMEFEQTGEGDQNGNMAILNLWMSEEYWDCYEPQIFNFRITARMELPIWVS